MTDTAFQAQYRQEFIQQFEVGESVLRKTVTTEAVIKGQQAVFLVAGSGTTPASAVTRGVNGLIPARSDNNVQNTATLQEWHDLVRKTGFNVFASQGDQRRIMQETTKKVLNRKIDLDVLGELANSTQHTNLSSAPVTASLNLVMKAKTILLNNYVPADGNINAVISPAFEAYLMQTKEFANANYVNDKPFESGQRMFRWAGVNFVVSPLLTGLGTNNELCFFYHKDAIGHAIAMNDLQTAVGYQEEQDYSFARASVFMGPKLLQNSGVVQVYHDGSAYAAV